jgi:hypothetical protein
MCGTVSSFPYVPRGVYTEKCTVLYFPLPYKMLFGVHPSTAQAFSLRPIAAKVMVRQQASNARFVLDEVELVQRSFLVLRVSPISVTLPMIHTH